MNEERLIFISLVLLGVTHAFPANPTGNAIPAVKGLVSRILGESYVDKFVYQEIDPSGQYDVFEIDGDSGVMKPVLRGNNGVALASAFNFYLKYWCNCSISWGRDGTGDQLRVPDPLPIPAKSERHICPNRFR